MGHSTMAGTPGELPLLACQTEKSSADELPIPDARERTTANRLVTDDPCISQQLAVSGWWRIGSTFVSRRSRLDVCEWTFGNL